MQHFRAEVRELHRLLVRHLRQHERRRHDPRIGAQHAVHVGPDLDERRADGGADDRRAVIRSVPPDRRRLAVVGGADEAGDDRSHARRAAEERVEVRARAPVRLFEHHGGVRELIVGDDDVARVDEHRGRRLVEIGRDNHR